MNVGKEVSNLKGTKQYISFTVGDEKYGLDLMEIDSIERLSPITRVPKSKDFVLGVINLRGDIIPVIDTRKIIGIPPKAHDEQTRIIITKYEDCSIGILVDNVINILEVSEDQIQRKDEVFEDKIQELVAGLIRTGTEIVLILDLEKILSF